MRGARVLRSTTAMSRQLLGLLAALLAGTGCATFQPPPVEAPARAGPTASAATSSGDGAPQQEPPPPGEWAPLPEGHPDVVHGPLFGVMGSRRFYPGLRTEVLGLQLGYHFLVGRTDHAITVTGGMAFGSGNCGDDGFDGRLSYSFLHNFAWHLVTGAEVSLWGFDQQRCHRTAERSESEHVRDVVSLAWLFGARLDPFVFGLSLRGGMGPWERGTSFGDGPGEDAGGQSITVDGGLWVQLRL